MTARPSMSTPAVALWMALSPPAFVSGLMRIDPGDRAGGGARGPRINSRLGWFVMELPALAVFLAIYLHRPIRHAVGDITVAMWVAHYAHRSLVWPWCVRRRDGQCWYQRTFALYPASRRALAPRLR